MFPISLSNGFLASFKIIVSSFLRAMLLCNGEGYLNLCFDGDGNTLLICNMKSIKWFLIRKNIWEIFASLKSKRRVLLGFQSLTTGLGAVREFLRTHSNVLLHHAQQISEHEIPTDRQKYTTTGFILQHLRNSVELFWLSHFTISSIQL